jgi:hypothetical protein
MILEKNKIEEFNSYINRYEYSFYTNIGDMSFLGKYIKLYNNFTGENLLYEKDNDKIKSINKIIRDFCDNKILNFLTNNLIVRGVINKDFQWVHEIHKKKEIIEKPQIIKKEGKGIIGNVSTNQSKCANQTTKEKSPLLGKKTPEKKQEKQRIKKKSKISNLEKTQKKEKTNIDNTISKQKNQIKSNSNSLVKSLETNLDNKEPDKKRKNPISNNKRIRIKGVIYDIPDCWKEKNIYTWSDFCNFIMDKVKGKYPMVDKDFKDNLSNIIHELGSIKLKEIMIDIALQYKFLEESYIKYYINHDFSDDD